MNISEFIKEDNSVNQKEVKKCIQCGVNIPSDSSRYSVRKFCSRKCNRRYFSLRRYHKIKKSDNYKDYRKSYYRKWVDKNRDKFNNYMKELMRKRSLKNKEVDINANL